MSSNLSVVYIVDGVYSIKNVDYGWELCSVSFSMEAREELDEFQQHDMLERLADWAGARLRELREQAG